MKLHNLTKSLIPNTIVRNPTHLKTINYSTLSENDIRITTLLPNNYDHFETFRKVITNESILFSSTTMQKSFDFKELRKKCSHTKIKLQLVEEGDDEIALPDEIINLHKKGVSPSQIALDRFFAIPNNTNKLREIYLNMTGKTEETGLGYYKFESTLNNKLLGGGVLAPISNDIPVEKVDIAMHILDKNKGIGTFCLNKLLTRVFEEYKVQQVWGSSIMENSKIPTLCSRYGMIIRNRDGVQHYFIDKDMWDANKEALKVMDDEPRAAATYYGKGKGKGR